MRRREDGAVAVMVAVLAVVLLSAAALTVDLGRAYVEKRDLQKVTDHAALAGGAVDNLPGLTVGSCGYGPRAAFSDPAVLDTAAFLGSGPWAAAPSAASLADCHLANGEVVYGRMTYSGGAPKLVFDPAELTLISPSRRVDFGLAGAMGFTGTSVSSTATVAVGTPGAQKVVPSYAISGCDWGAQTITNPAAGHATSFVPSLAHPADANMVDLEPSVDVAPNPYPSSIDVNPGQPTVVTLRGDRLDKVTKVGFFREATGSEAAAPAPLVVAQSEFHERAESAGDSIALTLPAGADVTSPLHDVVDSDQVWWLRVWAPVQNANDNTMAWSNVTRNGSTAAQPFRVGSAYLRCVGTANQGNYGTLILPRTDSTNNTSSGWLPRNIAANLQSPLTLHTYPGAPTALGAPSQVPSICNPSDVRSVYSTTTGTPVLRQNTNCVDADTGLPANAVSAGLVEGVGSTAAGDRIDGRLVTAAATSCNNRSNRVVTLAGNRKYLLNDDALSCFLEPGFTVGQIASPGYAGGDAFDCGVFDSPRFFYQPVLQMRPGSGGSQHYSIVDFRPAFITDQAMTADRSNTTTSADNGVRVINGAIQQVDVVFFNNRALPDSCPAAFGPALGGTTKRTVRLVD